jgi:hypothetical protein
MRSCFGTWKTSRGSEEEGWPAGALPAQDTLVSAGIRAAGAPGMEGPERQQKQAEQAGEQPPGSSEHGSAKPAEASRMATTRRAARYRVERNEARTMAILAETCESDE